MLEKDQHFSAPWTDSGDSDEGIGTLKLDKADCSHQLTMTTYNDTDYLYADLYWEHEVSYDLWNNEVGEVPDDIIGTTFEGRDYDIVPDDWNSGDTTTEYKNDHNGIVFKYCDACCENYDGGCPDSGNTYTTSDYCGTMLQVDATSDSDLRKVYTDYWHTYKDVVVESVSIGSDGTLGVSLSDETKKWLKEDEAVESNF